MAYSHGSVVRLSLKNFMQYVEVEVFPGPSLNVVIGPNGSGKSALVNALALALGAKTSVLGRADSITEFIRYGADSAETEIELNNAEGGGTRNYVINRKWGRDSKSHWLINGRKATGKEVSKLVESLNIQTDNLCQFLPQDKVHDFSKMNSKDLLTKTVAAFGEPDLKEDHEVLRYLAEDLAKREEVFQTRSAFATEQRKRYEELEVVVKSYTDKENLGNKVKLLQQRREWANVAELNEQVEKCKARRDRRAEKLAAVEAVRRELSAKVQTARKSNNLIETQVAGQIIKVKELQLKARNKGHKINRIGETLETLNETFKQRVAQEKDKQKQLKTLDTEIASLKREIEGETDTENLDQRIRQVSDEMQRLLLERENFKQEATSTNHERNAVDAELSRLKTARARLHDIDFHKREKLRNGLPNGKEICSAIDWIEANRDQLVGEVYMPIALLLNVINTENANFVEASIPQYDLVAFGVENPRDAELLINQCRKKMNLSFNVIIYKPNPDLTKFKTNPREFHPSLGFKGYVSEMFEAPDPVMAYLCELYRLHEAPAFGAGAKAKVEKLAEDFKFRMFFVENWQYRVKISRYTGKPLINSKQIATKNLLGTSVDKNELKKVEQEIEIRQQRIAELMDRIQTINAAMKVCDKKNEAVCVELKDLNSRAGHKRILKGRLSAKEGQREKLLQQMRPDEVEKAEKKLKMDQKRLLAETIALIKEVKDLSIEANNLRTTSDLGKIKIHQSVESVEALKQKQETLDGRVDELQIGVGEEEESLRRAKFDYNHRLETAQGLVGRNFKGTQPPPKLLEEFKAEGISEIGSDEAKIRINELEGQLECLDDVNPEIFREFKQLKIDLNVLKDEIEATEQEVANKSDKMKTIKERWLNRLESLIIQVNEKFQHFFGSMGFAGEVQLHRGNSENDFANYGIDILVKFRENMPLQKLDPFRQSGGERSVSTALYMMALQSLTKVPFRCVDEINQGMDEVNERKVFDMLMRTAVKDQTAQYFLLTPKLLPNLSYQEGVTILIVHHGEEMCPYTEWNMDAFVEATARNTG